VIECTRYQKGRGKLLKQLGGGKNGRRRHQVHSCSNGGSIEL